jgi:hypothetical protein
MSFHHSPRIVTDKLTLYVDFANARSYNSGSIQCTDLVNNIQGLITASSPNPANNHDEINRYSSEHLGTLIFPVTTSMDDRGNTVEFTQSFTPTSLQAPYGAGGWFTLDANAPRTGSIFSFVSNSYGGSWTSVAADPAGTSIYLLRRNGFGPFSSNLITNTLTPNTPFYVHVNIIDNTSAQAFVNGVKELDSTSLSSRGVNNRTDFIIGALRLAGPVPYDYWAGSASVAYTITGSLTEQEVLQNFNALRGRFGI